MSASRFVLLAALAACCIAAHAALVPVKQDAFQTVGTCKDSDVLLHAETVWKSAKWLQIRHQLVSYPADQTEEPAGVISCVQLAAQKNTNIGSAILQSGGPGQRAATIMVKSERGHSVGWNVLIFGSKE